MFAVLFVKYWAGGIFILILTGGDKIDQIRKRLEEEELIRAQKYKDIIDQSV